MAKNNEPDIFGGFEAILGSDLMPKGGNPDLADVPELDNIADLEDDDSDDDTTKKKKPTRVDDDDDDDDDVSDEGNDTDDEDDVKQPDANSLAEFEPQIAKFFQEKFAESFGMEFDENDTFESIGDLVDRLKEEVAKASEPVYANDEIKSLNEFVTNGGNIVDYLAYSKPNGLDIDKLDVDNEADLKSAIQEKLKLQGYDSDRIRRALSRYESSDTLQEEGEDAIDYLKEYKEKNQGKLLEDQQKAKVEAEKRQRVFVDTVEKRIDDLKEVKGYKISDKQRKELKDYIFKPGPDGTTAYQKQYMSDVLNLIESAYFVKYGDQLVKKAKDAGQSVAYKDLHQKLAATKGKMRSSGAANRGSSSSDSLINLIGKHLI